MSEILDRCVFVVGRQRTGTTVLRQALASHGQVHDLGEVMHANRQHGFYAELCARLTQSPSTGLHTQWFDILLATLHQMAPPGERRVLLVDMKYDAALDFGTRFIGPKMVSTFAWRVRYHQSCVIHIVRRNKLALLASVDLARKTGQWSIKRGEPHHGQRIALDPHTLHTRIAAEEAVDAYFTAQFAGMTGKITVVYEDLFQPDGRLAPHCFGEVAQRFWIDPSFNLQPRLVKQGRPLTDTIANFDAVAAQIETLVGTGALSPIYREYLRA